MLPEPLAPLVERAPGVGIVTDFDGTLAPIIGDPATACALPAAVEALTVLARRLALVGVVSGRPVAFLRTHLPIAGIELVGQYGLEWSEDGRDVLDPRVGAHTDHLAAAARDAETRWPDLPIERKGAVAFTVHWRTAPERAPNPAAVLELAHRHGLRAEPARMAYELRAPLDVDKGDGVRRLVRGRALEVLAFAGDDRGDLAAFDALDTLGGSGGSGGSDGSDGSGGSGESGESGGSGGSERGVGHVVRIAVASEEEPPELVARADLVVDGPVAFAGVLGELARALNERG